MGLVVTRLLSKVPCGLSFNSILSHGVVCKLRNEGGTRLGLLRKWWVALGQTLRGRDRTTLPDTISSSPLTSQSS